MTTAFSRSTTSLGIATADPKSRVIRTRFYRSTTSAGIATDDPKSRVDFVNARKLLMAMTFAAGDFRAKTEF